VWRQSGIDQQRNLVMQAETWKAKRIALSVPENSDAGLRHRGDEFFLVGECCLRAV